MKKQIAMVIDRDDQTFRDKSERTRINIGFEKAHLLPSLFGDYDRNLLEIEKHLGVTISCRGKSVSIEGEKHKVSIAHDVLQELYRLADVGREINESIIETQLRSVSEPLLRGVIQSDKPVPMISIRTRKKTIVPRSTAQAAYIQSLMKNEIVFALGPAGTGKTYVAVAQAVAMLITGAVERLILSRPAVEAGEKLGFLPGDMKEKVDPYLRPIYDALNDCLPPEQVERRIAAGEIEVAPLAFMRGRTLADAFIILDEAQNTTPAQMKMFLTRFGQNSRMVICGDPNQTDLPGGTAMSGLTDAVTRLEGVEGIAVSRFGSGDVVRHPVVGRIVQAYER